MVRTGKGKVLRWNKKALLNYAPMSNREGKARLVETTLDEFEYPSCAECDQVETTKHVALV